METPGTALGVLGMFIFNVLVLRLVIFFCSFFVRFFSVFVSHIVLFLDMYVQLTHM